MENAAGQVRTAGAWVPARGQARELTDGRVTAQRYPVPVVCVKQRAMEGGVVLATTLRGDTSVVELYGRRFSRAKNTSATRKTPATAWASVKHRCEHARDRRDRFLVITMLATIWTQSWIGWSVAAGRMRPQSLKANTSTLARTPSSVKAESTWKAVLDRYREALKAAFMALLKAPRPRDCYIRPDMRGYLSCLIRPSSKKPGVQIARGEKKRILVETLHGP